MRMHKSVIAKTVFLVLLLVSLTISATVSGTMIRLAINSKSIIIQGMLIPLSVLAFPVLMLYTNAVFMGAISRFKKRMPASLRTELLDLHELGIFFSVYNSLHQISFSITRLLEPVLQGSLRNILYKLMGAKIGRNVRINGLLVEPDFITIGDNTIIGHKALITGHIVDNNNAYLDKVVIGKNCLIGGFSVIAPGVIIEDRVTVGALSLVPRGKKIPKGSTYLSLQNRIVKK
jgi:acetyltransferase-like isoleucine patch superfamily enzyme